MSEPRAWDDAKAMREIASLRETTDILEESIKNKDARIDELLIKVKDLKEYKRVLDNVNTERSNKLHGRKVLHDITVKARDARIEELELLLAMRDAEIKKYKTHI